MAACALPSRRWATTRATGAARWPWSQPGVGRKGRAGASTSARTEPRDGCGWPRALDATPCDGVAGRSLRCQPAGPAGGATTLLRAQRRKGRGVAEAHAGSCARNCPAMTLHPPATSSPGGWPPTRCWPVRGPIGVWFCRAAAAGRRCATRAAPQGADGGHSPGLFQMRCRARCAASPSLIRPQGGRARASGHRGQVTGDQAARRAESVCRERWLRGS